MRDLAQIDKEIAEVKARIAKRNEGMPNYGDPGYRAARFDYIVEGDRSGLDAYQNALNAAIQNKLSRESAERMAKAGKAQADEEQRYQWQKDYAIAKSAQREIMANKSSSEKDKRDAATNVKYYEDFGTKKGWMPKVDPSVIAAEQAKDEEARKAQTSRESNKAKLAYYLTKDRVPDADLDTYRALNEEQFFDKANDMPYTGYEETYWDNQSKIDALKKANFNDRAKKYMADVLAKLANKNINTEGKVVDLLAENEAPEDYSKAEGWDKFQSEIENKKKGFRDAAGERKNRIAAANGISATAVKTTTTGKVSGSANGSNYEFDVVENPDKGVYELKIGKKIYRTVPVF
jgi:hypothetical protein